MSYLSVLTLVVLCDKVKKHNLSRIIQHKTAGTLSITHLYNTFTIILETVMIFSEFKRVSIATECIDNTEP